MTEKSMADHRFRLKRISTSEGAKLQRVTRETADMPAGKPAPPQPITAEAKAGKD